MGDLVELPLADGPVSRQPLPEPELRSFEIKLTTAATLWRQAASAARR